MRWNSLTNHGAQGKGSPRTVDKVSVTFRRAWTIQAVIFECDGWSVDIPHDVTSQRCSGSPRNDRKQASASLLQPAERSRQHVPPPPPLLVRTMSDLSFVNSGHPREGNTCRLLAMQVSVAGVTEEGSARPRCGCSFGSGDRGLGVVELKYEEARPRRWKNIGVNEVMCNVKDEYSTCTRPSRL